jgi:hypothetical protein
LPGDETERAVHDLSIVGIKDPVMIVDQVILKEVLKGNWFLERRRAIQDK